MKARTAFEVEDWRSKLAIKDELRTLKNTYFSKNLEIEDFNTSEMWSDLNTFEITPDSYPMAWERVNEVASLVKSPGKVLDIGFGSGIVEELLSKKDKKLKVYGIDIAKESVRLIKEKVPHGEFRLGSILKLPYKQNTFDYVLSLEILEHIQPHNTFKALAEVKRVIRQGGHFIVSVPLNEGLEEMIARGENPNAHVRVYTPELIKAELRIVGFDVLKEKTLYAFHKHHGLKSILARLLGRQPNNIILLCQKY